jgi:hypothetical protein
MPVWHLTVEEANVKTDTNFVHRLEAYGLISESDARRIYSEHSEVRVRQIDGYDPPRIFLHGSEVRFRTICELVCSRTRYVSNISGCPDWSSDPCWRLSRDTALAAELSGMPAKKFTSLFSEATDGEGIPGSYKPTQFTLIGSAQLLEPSIPIRRTQLVPLVFTFSDETLCETLLEFTVTGFVPRSRATSSGVPLSGGGDEHPPDINIPYEEVNAIDR